MAKPVANNWVAESTRTIGTGNIVLVGALPGYASFSTFNDGDLVYYVAQQGTNRECGIGTYASSIITRTQILATLINGTYTSGGSPLSLNGDASVYCIVPAELVNQFGIDSEKLEGIESGATVDQDAIEVPFDPTGSSYTSTDVQNALVEVFDALDVSIFTNSQEHTILQLNIDTVQSNLDAVALAYQLADDQLQTNIDTVITNYQAADTQLQNNIDSAISDYEAADLQLQQNIDDLDSRKVEKTSDVGAAIIPSGTSAERPTGEFSYFRENTETGEYEVYNTTTQEWGAVGGGGVPPIATYYTSNFTVVPKKVAGILHTVNDAIVANIESDSWAVDAWAGFIDTQGAWGESVFLALTLSGDSFWSQLDAQGNQTKTLILNKRNASVKIIKLANGDFHVESATFGQDIDYLAAKVDTIAAKNILINGAFDSWQEGTIFTGSGYTADMAVSLSGAANEIRLAWTMDTGSYAQLSLNDATQNLILAQRVEYPWKYHNKDLTFSARYLGDDIASSGAVIAVYMYVGGVATVVHNHTLTKNGINSTTFNIDMSAYAFNNDTDYMEIRYFTIYENVGTAGTVYGVTELLLEEGTERTSFVADDLEVNLAKCQRHFEIGDKNWSVYSSVGTAPIMNTPFKVTKRKNPVVSINTSSANNISLSSITISSRPNEFDVYGATMSVTALCNWNHSWIADARL